MVSTLPLAALAAFGCDSTVALDTTLPSLTDVFVSGVCPVNDSYQDLELSLILLNQDDENANLLPNSRVQKERASVEVLLQTKFTESFKFELPSVAPAELRSSGKVAYMTPEAQGSSQTPLSIAPSNIRFDYSGDNIEADPYMILLLDHSLSMLGYDNDDPANPGRLVLNKGSDPSDQRVAFFQQLLKNLPSNYYASIISFKGELDDAETQDNLVSGPISLNPSVSYEVPNLGGSGGDTVTKTGLKLLEDRLNTFSVKSTLEIGTPLRRGLNTGYELALEALDSTLTTRGLRPVVVLFTDGVEEGDTSGSESLLEIAAKYKEAGVPVHIVHLQPPVTVDPSRRGRDAEFAAFACQTNGDYLFVPKADTFSESKTLSKVLNSRLEGRWVLGLDTSFDNEMNFPTEQGYLFNSVLQVTLGGVSQNYSISRSEDNDSSRDQRLWLYKGAP